MERERLIEREELGDVLLKSYFGGIRPVLVRPELNSITGGFLSTAIFERIIYMSKRYEKVWMFTTPSKHKDYKKGKSWCEIFNVTQFQFNTALKRFAFKLGKTQNTIKKEDALVTYYKGNDNKTYFEVNEPLVKLKMAELFETGVLDYLGIKETSIPKGIKETSIPKGIQETSIPNNKEIKKECKKSIINNVKTPPVNFNYEEEEWKNVTEEYGNELKARFPNLNLKKEFLDMKDWLIDHKDKPKKKFRSFITNWLKNSEKSPKKISMEESLRILDEEFAPDSRVDLREKLEEKITKKKGIPSPEFIDYAAEPRKGVFVKEKQKVCEEGKLPAAVGST